MPQAPIPHSETALALAIENSIERHMSKAHDGLSQAYEQLRQFAWTLEPPQKYGAYTQKNNDLERNKTIEVQETRYHTVKKENQQMEQEKSTRSSHQRNHLSGERPGLSILTFLGFQLVKTREDRNDKKAFAEALIFAQEKERKHIDCDLLDGIGQSLLLIKRQMEAHYLTSQENKQLIGSTLEEVRSLSRDLYPFQLAKFGLTATIKDSLDKAGRRADLSISREIDNIDGMVSEKMEINVFRTVQEAMSNIIKHAQASAVKVTVKAHNTEISVSIQDNGRGFDHEMSLIKSKNLGLRTLHERISALNGKMNMAKGDINGTILSFTIPRTDHK